jgi:hypothetical protein
MMARLACVKPQILASAGHIEMLADQRQSELMTDELHVSSFSHGYDSHTRTRALYVVMCTHVYRNNKVCDVANPMS